MYEVNKEIIVRILRNMPLNKKNSLYLACDRNAHFTSEFGLENCTLTIYKEGWLLEFDGCRSHFQVWVDDKDGQFGFGRKPAEKKLHKLYSEWTKTECVIDLYKYFHQIVH